MQPILLFLMISGSMFTRDIVYTMGTAFVAHGKAAPASAADVIGDWMGLVSVGIGAASVFHGGLVSAICVLAGMAVGSVFGTYGGVRLEALYERRFGQKIPHRSEGDHTPV